MANDQHDKWILEDFSDSEDTATTSSDQIDKLISSSKKSTKTKESTLLEEMCSIFEQTQDASHMQKQAILAKTLLDKANPSLFISTNSMFQPPRPKNTSSQGVLKAVNNIMSSGIGGTQPESHYSRYGWTDPLESQTLANQIGNRPTSAYPSQLKDGASRVLTQSTKRSIFQEAGKLTLTASSTTQDKSFQS